MKKISFNVVADALIKFRFPKVDLVVGIAQGGRVPAALVAYWLGKDIDFLKINYRDECNQPQHPHPVLLKLPRIAKGVKRILLVDDVSVSGETLKAGRKALAAYHVRTFVLRGKADHVLFPALRTCVEWPWKRLQKA